MAGFQAHLTGGIASGAVISLIGLFTRDLTLTQATAIFVVGSVAGLLPDLDSDTGKPLTFLFQFISILIPSMLIIEATRIGGDSPEFLICYLTISYLFINYIVCFIIRKITIHRGMMHSIPFAFACSGIGYLLFGSSSEQMALIAGIAVFSGCFIHLVLDELNSITLKYGFIPTLKKSSGTAFKLRSSSLTATLFIYIVLACVTVKVFFS